MGLHLEAAQGREHDAGVALLVFGAEHSRVALEHLEQAAFPGGVGLFEGGIARDLEAKASASAIRPARSSSRSLSTVAASMSAAGLKGEAPSPAPQATMRAKRSIAVDAYRFMLRGGATRASRSSRSWRGRGLGLGGDRAMGDRAGALAGEHPQGGLEDRAFALFAAGLALHRRTARRSLLARESGRCRSASARTATS